MIMIEVPNSDQIPERPLFKLKANYNEQFLLPDVEINPGATIDKSVLNRDWHANDKLPRFEIEVQGHPGYPIQVRKGHSVDMETSTTVIGFIFFNGVYELVTNPFTRSSGSYRDRVYFSPFGHTNIESVTDVDEKGHLRLKVKKVPTGILVFLEDIWEATEGKDPTRAFLIYKNKAIEGVPLPYDKYGSGGKGFIIDENCWVDLKKTRPRFSVGGLDRGELSSRLLLPSDPEFFKTVRILIGDKPPELNA